MVKKLTGTISHFRPFSALVLGDFMLDRYMTGRVKRISPEAPVQIVEVKGESVRPGGAGNVVLSFLALGGYVYASGRVGNDQEGKDLTGALTKDGVDISALIVEEDHRTPVKTRLIAGSQQLLRVDIETIQPLLAKYEEMVLRELEAIIPKVQVVAISDYGKGFLTNTLIKRAIELSNQHQIPVVVDPKGLDFTKYKHATILKPNLGEAYAAAKKPHTESLDSVAKTLLELSEVEVLLITRSEEGMSLFTRDGKRVDFPVRSREVTDVTGAGDTVLAMISTALANGLDLEHAIQLGNIAAGIAIERVGCAQVTLTELAHRLLEVDTDTKIFDETQIYALQKVLKNEKYSVLVLEKDKGVSVDLFRIISKMSEGQELILYVKGARLKDDFVHLLSSLKEVDYIILHVESLELICDAIRPAQLASFEGGKVKHLRSASALLETLKTAAAYPS